MSILIALSFLGGCYFGKSGNEILSNSEVVKRDTIEVTKKATLADHTPVKKKTSKKWEQEAKKKSKSNPLIQIKKEDLLQLVPGETFGLQRDYQSYFGIIEKDGIIIDYKAQVSGISPCLEELIIDLSTTSRQITNTVAKKHLFATYGGADLSVFFQNGNKSISPVINLGLEYKYKKVTIFAEAGTGFNINNTLAFESVSYLKIGVRYYFFQF